MLELGKTVAGQARLASAEDTVTRALADHVEHGARREEAQQQERREVRRRDDHDADPSGFGPPTSAPGGDHVPPEPADGGDTPVPMESEDEPHEDHIRGHDEDVYRGEGMDVDMLESHRPQCEASRKGWFPPPDDGSRAETPGADAPQAIFERSSSGCPTYGVRSI